MIDIDSIRHHNEKLKIGVEAYVGEGDWLYALSGWHPIGSEKKAAVAETAAWGLILFKTKQIEFIYRARQLFKQLLKLQNEEALFPRYLHEVHQSVCSVSSFRIFLVMMALKKWHEQALGISLCESIDRALSKMQSSESFLKILQEAQKPQNFEQGVMPAWLARYLWSMHVLEVNIDQEVEGKLQSLVSKEGMNWLEKPKGLLPDESCWLDVWQSINKFSAEYSPKLKLCHLWTSLLHSEGSHPKFDMPTKEAAYLFRSMPLARERRGYAQSCFLSLKPLGSLCIRALATYAQIEGQPSSFCVSYDPEQGLFAEEDYPCFEIVITPVHSWIFEGQVFSALKMTPGQRIQIKLAGTTLSLEIHSSTVGHLRQKPSLRSEVRRSQTLYFTPADIKKARVFNIRLVDQENLSC